MEPFPFFYAIQLTSYLVCQDVTLTHYPSAAKKAYKSLASSVCCECNQMFWFYSEMLWRWNQSNSHCNMLLISIIESFQWLMPLKWTVSSGSCQNCQMASLVWLRLSIFSPDICYIGFTDTDLHGSGRNGGKIIFFFSSRREGEKKNHSVSKCNECDSLSFIWKEKTTCHLNWPLNFSDIYH